MKYAFIKSQESQHSVRRMCRLLDLHPSGYYAWCKEPDSLRAADDRRLLGRIRHAWLESGGVYGYRKVCDDMRDLGETCGANRVARLMRAEGLRAQPTPQAARSLPCSTSGALLRSGGATSRATNGGPRCSKSGHCAAARHLAG